MLDDDAPPTPEDVAQELPDLLLVDEAAAYFRVQRTTFVGWLRKGLLPDAYKIGGTWRIPKDAVRAHDRYLRGDRTGERTPTADPRSARFEKED